MQEPTLSFDDVRSPLMYNLSCSLEAILYGHTLGGIVQDWYTSFSETLHQDIHGLNIHSLTSIHQGPGKGSGHL